MKVLEFFLAILFISIVTLFQLHLFSIGFCILLFMIITVIFFNENKRVFVWMVCAYCFGDFAAMYGEKLVAGLVESEKMKTIINRLLLLLPTLLMCYVMIMFKKNINRFHFLFPQWNRTIFMLLRHKISVSHILIIGLCLTILYFIPLIQSTGYETRQWTPILLYVVLHALLVEFLWRGIILTQFIVLIGEKLAISFSSIAFGLTYMSFGFSIISCMGYGLLGALFSVMTLRSNSLLPSIIWHSIFVLLFILSGHIPILLV